MMWCSTHGAPISTHTLARRVTLEPQSLTFPKAISTHTLARRVTRGEQGQGRRPAISTHTLARRVTAKAHKKAARFCSKGTALRRNCLAVVHERAAVPLLQAVFCRVILHFYGAKVPWECWALMVRTGTAGFMIRCATPSGRLPAGSRRFVRNAVFFVHTDCPSNKTAGYPTPRP